jgi:hypothetical protein
MTEAVPKVKHPPRKRSGTAKWHMSREAVDLPLADIYQMDEHACWKFFVETRFGSKDTVRCPYCGSIGKTTSAFTTRGAGNATAAAQRSGSRRARFSTGTNSRFGSS